MRNLSATLTSIAILLVATACSSSGARSAGTYSSLETTQRELVSTRDQINKTAQSLQQIMAQSGDLKDSWKDFTGDVDRMNDLSRKLEKRANETREKRADYLRQWTKESERIANPEIAALSSARKQEIEYEFGVLTESMTAARDAMVPYVSDLNDIRTYLKNDLTANGVQTIRPVTERVLPRGFTVNESLDRAIAALSRVSAKLEPTS